MKPVRDRALMESQTRSRPDHLRSYGGRAAVSLTLFSLSVSHTQVYFFLSLQLVVFGAACQMLRSWCGGQT